jgi:hypothetical protein
MRRTDGAGGGSAGRLSRRVITLAGLSIALVMLMASSALALVFQEQGDAPSLPPGQPVPAGTCEITGALGGAEDVYRIQITDPANFTASTVGTPGTLPDPQLFLFNTAGQLVAANDDFNSAFTPPPLNRDAQIGPDLAIPAGTYDLAITSFDRDPVFTGGVITGWQGTSEGTGTYTITLTGVAGCASGEANLASATRVLCAQGTTPPNNTLSCKALVGDATPGASVDPEGVVAFFLNAISSNTFIGQCTLGPQQTAGGSGGLSKCGVETTAVPAGPQTVWAVYYPAAGSPYQGSVDSDDVGNADVDNPEPSDTKGLCVDTDTAGSTQALNCHALVADDDSDVSPDPAGTAAFFRQAISSNTFLGQCTLGPSVTGGPALTGGVSQCGTTTSQDRKSVV